MSVCGIVILITLLLILQLVTEQAMSQPDTPASESVPALSQRIEQAKDVLRSIQNEITQLQNAPLDRPVMTRIELEQRIAALSVSTQQQTDATAELEALIKSSEQRLEVLNQSPIAMQITDLENAIVSTKTLTQELEIQLKSSVVVKSDLQKEIPPLAAKNAALDQQLGSRLDKIIKFTRRKSTEKSPFLLLYGKSELSVRSFATPTPKLFKTVNEFLAWAKKDCNSRTEFFVVYVRPSQIADYETLLDSLKDAGFDVGFDVIGEKTDVSLW